jgi:Lrp/AsnC family transcriptional regulator, leucine-responsive regulatory protein
LVIFIREGEFKSKPPSSELNQSHNRHMRFDPKAGLDAIDWALLNLLHKNARLSLAALGRKLHLSAPAIAERMKRLEERGVIRAYRAEIDLSALGRVLNVYLRAVVQPKDYARFKKAVESFDEILECHHVTGEESFVLRAAVTGVPSLDILIQKLTVFGPTTTSVILSTSLDRRNLRSIQTS